MCRYPCVGMFVFFPHFMQTVDLHEQACVRVHVCVVCADHEGVADSAYLGLFLGHVELNSNGEL